MAKFDEQCTVQEAQTIHYEGDSSQRLNNAQLRRYQFCSSVRRPDKSQRFLLLQNLCFYVTKWGYKWRCFTFDTRK